MDLKDAERLEKEATARATPWRKLMLDSADYIEMHGLFQGGDLSNLEGDKFCAIGTMRFLCVGNAYGRFAGTAANEAWEVLRPLVPGCVVSHWSDTTPPHEVVATLRRVALGGL